MKTVSNIALSSWITLWALTVCGAFWRFEWRYLRPVARPAGTSAVPVARLLGVLQSQMGPVSLDHPGTTTLLNFWAPSCACSRYNETHVANLIQAYGQRGVRFITVLECGQSAGDQEDAQDRWRERRFPNHPYALDPGGKAARQFGVWAAPAAVILDRNGNVRYVGGYNAARFCDDKRTAWAAAALEATVGDRRPKVSTAPFYGCQVTPAGSVEADNEVPRMVTARR